MYTTHKSDKKYMHFTDLNILTTVIQLCPLAGIPPGAVPLVRSSSTSLTTSFSTPPTPLHSQQDRAFGIQAALPGGHGRVRGGYVRPTAQLSSGAAAIGAYGEPGPFCLQELILSNRGPFCCCKQHEFLIRPEILRW